MTPPIPGQIYERDGLRREVLAVTGAAALTRVHWKRPDSEVKQKCWFDYWRAWASKATLVETNRET